MAASVARCRSYEGCSFGGGLRGWGCEAGQASADYRNELAQESAPDAALQSLDDGTDRAGFAGLAGCGQCRRIGTDGAWLARGAGVQETGALRPQFGAVALPASALAGAGYSDRARRHQWLTSPVIARVLGMAPSTVGLVLRRLGLNRLSRLEFSTPVIRYERERAGEMNHLDIKTLGRVARPVPTSSTSLKRLSCCACFSAVNRSPGYAGDGRPRDVPGSALFRRHWSRTQVPVLTLTSAG